MSNRGTRRVKFNNSKISYANGLSTPSYVTVYNHTNPFLKAEGWQTPAERLAAIKHARIEKLLRTSLGKVEEPYAYQDPRFIYPKEARKNIANAATANLYSGKVKERRRTRRTRRHRN